MAEPERRIRSKWVLAAGRDVTAQEPKKAFDLERSAADKLKAIGIKIVTDVDKSGFSKISDPMLDKLAMELGPHADKIKTDQDQFSSYPTIGSEHGEAGTPGLSRLTPVMSIADKLVLQRQRHLKWRALEPLELILMIICGLTLFGFRCRFVPISPPASLAAPALAPGGYVHSSYTEFSSARQGRDSRNDHLYLTAVAESMHGRSRLIAELAIRLMVLCSGFLPRLLRLPQFLRGFGSFRLPSNTPIALTLCRNSAVRRAHCVVHRRANRQRLPAGFDHPELAGA